MISLKPYGDLVIEAACNPGFRHLPYVHSKGQNHHLTSDCANVAVVTEIILRRG